MKVLICGAGTVGLALGKCLRLAGHDIYFHEINPARQYILKGDGWDIRDYSPYAERGVSIERDAVFICVPTPTKDDGKQDLTSVKEVIKMLSLINNYSKSKFLFIKSTVLPGTMRKIVYPLMRKSGYTLVSNPEFLTESDPIRSMLNSPLMFGFKSNAPEKFDEFMIQLYPYPIFNGIPSFAKWEEIELAKYANNFLLASRISAWNQIKLIADRLKVNTKNMAYILSQDSKIGKYGMFHGKAFGGHCLPKDNEALISFAQSIGVSPCLIIETLCVNNAMKRKYGENTEKYVW